jgi:hypothetical protein
MELRDDSDSDSDSDANPDMITDAHNARWHRLISAADELLAPSTVGGDAAIRTAFWAPCRRTGSARRAALSASH